MQQRKWQILSKLKTHPPAGGSKLKATTKSSNVWLDKVVEALLGNRGLIKKKEVKEFFYPKEPRLLTARDVGIDARSLRTTITRISKALKNKESIVVYADYDADGITAGAIMWETLYKMGGRVMPYIPHRVEEGYGFSVKGIDRVIAEYHPTLIISVDHGITAREKVAYAKEKSIDVIVTDHHVRPKQLPRCPIVHTTKLSGAGVAWFVAKELISSQQANSRQLTDEKWRNELLALSAIGTIADMVPLVGENRALAKHGLTALNQTQRVGLLALIKDTGLTLGEIGTYEISHLLAPRLNAMGRLVHGLDALRLLCTKQADKAKLLAQKLGLTNRERQELTEGQTLLAKTALEDSKFIRQPADQNSKLLFVAHKEYNQGVIGLVAGKLVEEYYRPAIVVAKGEIFSKASARSINGFNIIEAIRSCSELLVDAGGHPMAAGFTVETANLSLLQDRLEKIADRELDSEKLTRGLKIDLEIPLELISENLWKKIQEFAPFGMENPEPVFTSRAAKITDARLVGAEGKHLKLRLTSHVSHITFDAIGFGMGELYSKLRPDEPVDIVYTIDRNTWNGNSTIQLKLKDIHFV